MSPVDLDSELVYEMEGPIKPACCVFLNLHNLQTLVHSFPFTFWSLKRWRRVVESVTKNKYKLRVFPPYSES